MKQPLVKPLDRKSTIEAETMANFYEETLGFTPNSLFTMMHRPRIAHAFVEMNQAVMENKGSITSSMKREIAYLSSMTTGCRYCEAHAIRAAERYGSTSERMENLWDYKRNNIFSDSDKAMFDFVIAASQVPNGVTEKISNKLREFFKEGEIVEILGVVALFGYLNRWNDSMGTELEKPAQNSANKILRNGWNIGKHQY